MYHCQAAEVHALGYALADALGHVQAVEDAQVHVKDVVPVETLVTEDVMDAPVDAAVAPDVLAAQEEVVRDVQDADQADARKDAVPDALTDARVVAEDAAEAVLADAAEAVTVYAVIVVVLDATLVALDAMDVMDVAVAAKTVAKQPVPRHALIPALINVMDIAQVVPPMLFMELNYLQNKWEG